MNYSQLRMANIRKWFSSDQAPLGGLQYDFKFVDAFICHNLDWDLSLKLQTFFKQNKFNIYWPWSTPGIQHIQVNTERRISCSHVLHYERGTRLSAGAAAGLAVPYIISKWKMRKAMRGSKRLGLIGQFTYLSIMTVAIQGKYVYYIFKTLYSIFSVLMHPLIKVLFKSISHYIYCLVIELFAAANG